MAEETKTKSTTKKPSTSTSKKSTSSNKNTTTSTRKKAGSETSKKSTSTSAKNPSSSTKKSTTTNSQTTKKVVSEDVKTVKNDQKTAPKAIKTEKKPKTKGRLKSNDELTAMEEIEAKVEGKVIREKVKRSKGFYLVFSLVLYAISFYYIFNVIYDNTEIVTSALFAFAFVFVIFVLLLFNVHLMIIGFFVLPFRTLFKQAKKEFRNEVEPLPNKNKLGNYFNRRRATYSIIFYALISALILYSVIADAIMEQDKIFSVVVQALTAEFIFLLIVCSWQYLFTIIPTILDKTIDAKNGFILSLSAIVMIIYVVFIIFDIREFSEMMIFILIIGFVALLGVNLNMIVGEINIFQNIRQKKSKAVTRIVFIIFFGFHIYVMLYASVVAYSIYIWDNDSYIFSNEVTERTWVEEVYDSEGDLINEVYNQFGIEIDIVYETDGMTQTPITEWYNEEEPITHYAVYDLNGQRYMMFYDIELHPYLNLYTKGGIRVTEPYYHDGTLMGYAEIPIEKTYSHFLYYAVVTISSVGYGDISPSIEHGIAMAWGGFLSIYGLTFYALSIGFVSNIAMEGITKNREED